GALHRGQHVGVDVGGTGQKKPPEGRGGGDGGRAHRAALARLSTSPSSTTSPVSTSRTPSSPQSLSSCSETSLSIPLTASVTTNKRVCGRRSGRPSIAALSHTSLARPYISMFCGGVTVRAVG